MSDRDKSSRQRPRNLNGPKLTGCLLGNAQKIPRMTDILDRLNDERYCTSCTEAFHALRITNDVFVAYGMKSDEKSEALLLNEFPVYHLWSKTDVLFDLMKFKCAASFSYIVGQPLPAVPDNIRGDPRASSPHWLPGIYYAFVERAYKMFKCYKDKRWIRDVKRPSSFFDNGNLRLVVSFAYSLLMLKKGLPRPSPLRCDRARREAFRTMTTPDDRTFSKCLTIDRVGSYADRVVDRLFGKVDFSQVELIWPSVSSHSTLLGSGRNSSRRSDDGAFGYLRSLGLLPQFSLRDFVRDPEERRENGSVVFLNLSEEARSTLIRCQADVLCAALDEDPQCFVQALPEACKVRTITAGPVLMYQALRPIQKMMHRALANDRRFVVDGMIDGRRILECLGRLGSGQKWLSGDYKAATDNLAIELSYRIAERIAFRTGMPDTYRELLIRSLVGHVYVEPDDSSTGYQARGQLMGSITSFPVLCIANFALIWASAFPATPFDLVEALVNGDDCLFATDQDGFDRWFSDAKDIGLSPSVGKTYFTEEFMVINSDLFINDLGPFDLNSGYECLPFINSGLLIGMKRSGDRETSCQKLDDRSTTIGARCTALLRGWGHDSPMRDSLIGLFLVYNSHLFVDKGECPLYLPERFGGYGIPFSAHFYPDETELSLWQELYEREQFFRNIHLTPIRPEPYWAISVRTLKFSTDVKCSPFYRDAVRDLSRRFGTRFTDSPFSVGAYQWCFSDQEVPVESDDNLDEFVRQWVRFRGRVPVRDCADFCSGGLYDYACFRYFMDPSTRPLRRAPAVMFANCEANLRVVGWGRVEPAFHQADDDRCLYHRRLCEEGGITGDDGHYPLMKFDSVVVSGGSPTFVRDRPHELPFSFSIGFCSRSDFYVPLRSRIWHHLPW